MGSLRPNRNRGGPESVSQRLEYEAGISSRVLRGLKILKVDGAPSFQGVLVCDSKVSNGLGFGFGIPA